MAVLKYKNPNYIVGGTEEKYLPLFNVIVGSSEIYIGEEEPTNGCLIWINPNNDEMKYWNGTEWVTASGGVEDVETLVITLASNQGGSDNKLIGAILDVVYNGESHRSEWTGEPLIFTIPTGVEYTINYSNIVDSNGNLLYSTPTSEMYIAARGNTRALTRYYSACVLTIQRTNNQGVTMSTATSATVTYSSYSQTVNFTSSINSVTITIPYNVSYTIAFNGTITNYRTPANITGTSNTTSKTVTGSYDSEKVTVSISSSDGSTSPSWILTINGESVTWAGSNIIRYIAYGTAYTVTISEDVNYSITPSSYSYTAGQTSREANFVYAKTGCSFTIINSNSSTSITTTGNTISWITGKRCLAKKTSDGVAICYLDASNSNLFHDGTTSASLDGSMGQWMTDLPEYYFYVDESTSGQHKVSLDAKEKSGWQKSRRVLLGVTKGIVTNNKLWSKSGYAPTVNQTIDTFHKQANACGSGFDIIDYETHCKLAHMFYAKYGNRDPQNMSQFGTGSNTTGRTSGTTASLGNTDGKSDTQVNIFGVEDPYGNVNEWMGGITGNGLTYYIYDGLTTDATPANSRTVSIPSKSMGFITKVKWGTYGDMIPTEFNNGSSTTYYADYGAVGGSGWRVVRRSFNGSSSDGGFAYFYGYYSSSESGSAVGSRLQYRGNITIIEDPAEFIALPVGF